ncbi:tRNA dihydrouridine synthase DusB [Candidatus Woesearchaeota archaeon]|jgi:tRNA-dihydrouridine synthase B|nr:tRNA dihydrouridine synthase DusB [Candidatus Woesearchaeota archaeon]
MKFPKLKSDTILAPMAGVTDVAFRVLCRKYGAGMAVTEMISANALARRNKRTLGMIDIVAAEKPRVIQLFGQNVEMLVKAAKYCEDKCEVLDLNFGCPATKIIKQGAGSALLERPNKIGEIVKAVSSAIKIPVTCKLRLGIRKNNINIVEVAKVCEEAGAAMIAIHARTQKQGYTGKADWSWIKNVKDSLGVPVAGNGDVCSVEDYVRMKKETGCDFVMIGRGVVGNPYLFKQIEQFNKKGSYSERDRKQQIEDFFEYLESAEKYKVGFLHVKFHAQSFTKGFIGASRVRDKIGRAKSFEEIEKVMKTLE